MTLTGGEVRTVETLTIGERTMPKTIEGRIVYSLDETAKRLGVSGRTIRIYLKAGRLRGEKWGRSWHITREAIQEFVDGKRKET
jgi:excisionase family DNA binding protein